MKNREKFTEQQIIEMVEGELSQAKEVVEHKSDIAVFHQDAFAADYQLEEIILLGLFIKYIGMKGKDIMINGKNRETLRGVEILKSKGKSD